MAIHLTDMGREVLNARRGASGRHAPAPAHQGSAQRAAPWADRTQSARQEPVPPHGDVDDAALRERGEQLEQMREAFFDSLPADEMTPQEGDLRAAIMRFLEDWRQDSAPTLSVLGSAPDIGPCKKALLPKGVSIHSWIDRRIGGEIETVASEKVPGQAQETFFGLRPIDTRMIDRGIAHANSKRKSAELSGVPLPERGARKGKGKSKDSDLSAGSPGKKGKGNGKDQGKGKGKEQGNGKGKVSGGGFAMSNQKRKAAAELDGGPAVKKGKSKGKDQGSGKGKSKK